MAAMIEAIRNPPSLDQQLAALRELKHHIVGHDQRKEALVKDGAVEPLVNILASAAVSTGKRRRSDANGASIPSAQSWHRGDEIRLQATLLIGTIANGGASFAQPLLAAGTPKVLLDTLATDAAPRLVRATLQALKNLSTSWAAAQDNLNPSSHAGLEILDKPSADILHRLLCQDTSSSTGLQHIRLVADIIAIAASVEATKAALVQGPILDTLAALLASYAIASKHVDFHGDTTHLPPSPGPQALPNILSAISSIISGSTYRVHRFFLSPPIRSLFLDVWSANGDQRYLLGPRHGFASPGREPLLPPLHIPAYGTTTYFGGSRAFPAMAALQSHQKRDTSALESVPQGGDLDHANAVCSWLLLLARSMEGHDRVIALKLLALVNNAIDQDVFNSGHRSEYIQKTKEREKQMSLLAVPLAVKLVQSANDTKLGRTGINEQQGLKLAKEHACEVLALLIHESPALQIAAVEANAIKYVCPVLKKSFDNVSLARPMWIPKSSDVDAASLPETCRLGHRGLPPEILHAMKCRQGALQALAALAEKEDLHRKAIVEAGVVSCIIDSLKPFALQYPEKLRINRGQAGPKDGNTISVILAACGAAKTMSRSVSLLRTSLIDAGIAKPIFHLLAHEDAEVQLAGTDVCINLLLEFSPMRDDLVAEGVVKTLAAHARQASSALRLSSMWALKHLMLASPKEIKINTLEELGSGWLVSAIQGEQRESFAANGGGVSVGLSTPNAAGEQVDLLNPSSMDVDNAADDEEQEIHEDDDGEVMYDESSSTHYQSSQLRSTLHPPPPSFNSKKYLSSVRELEQNPALSAKRDDIAVQEQALDFVRNFLNGEDCAIMLDHLLHQLGSTKIFELLAAKVAPLSASARLTGGSRQVYYPTELILSTVHIINNIAAASAKHKQLLIAQKPLLQAWLPHFNHVDRRVRVMCVWAVNSLTWIEDDSDRKDARLRAQELRALGIENAVRGLASDVDLDVKERVKTALRQFDQL